MINVTIHLDVNNDLSLIKLDKVKQFIQEVSELAAVNQKATVEDSVEFEELARTNDRHMEMLATHLMLERFNKENKVMTINDMLYMLHKMSKRKWMFNALTENHELVNEIYDGYLHEYDSLKMLED